MRPPHWIVALTTGVLLTGCRDHPLDAPADTPDIEPPATINDLAVDRPVDTTLHLSWSSSGDDGAIGTASLYEIRYSTQDLTDKDALSSAPRILLQVTEGERRRIDLAVGNLDRGRIYSFRVRAADEVPGKSCG